MSASSARQRGGIRVTPFWRRIPRVLLYPLAPRPLALMLLLALAGVAPLLLPRLANVFPLPPLAFGSWVVLLWIPFLRYAYGALERAANGVLSARERYASRPDMFHPWKQLPLVALALVLVWVAFARSGPLAGAFATCALVLVLPASIMQLARTGRLLAALDPVGLFGLVRSIGWAYLALWGLLMALLLLSNAAAAAASLALRGSPWVYPAASFVSMYFALVMYHLTGYVLYQYHARLGLYPTHSPPVASADQMRAWLRDPGALDAHLQRLAADGLVEQAARLLDQLIQREPRNLSLHERYDRALRVAGDHDAWSQHASEYLALLLREGQGALALGFFDQTRRAQAAFHPQEAATLVELARAARAHGRPALTSALLMEFGQRFPESTAQTEAYYLAAQLLHEDFGETDEARKLLEHVVRTDPSNPLALAAKRYLKALAGPVKR